MNAKDAGIAARKYFEETKSLIKFIFETVSVKKRAITGLSSARSRIYSTRRPRGSGLS